MAVKIGSARIDENNNTHGGQAGDQKTEVATQSWYLHKSGWRVFRPIGDNAADRIGRAMQSACDNPHVGYDQWQRDTLYNAVSGIGFDIDQLTRDVETDCSALVRVCCAYAGIMLPNFRTYNEPQTLLQSGAFRELYGDQYTKRSDYLRRGDVLCTPVSGHTVVVITNGPKSGEEETEMSLLKRGSKGPEVKTLQRLLNAVNNAGLDVDGDFGTATRNAVITYQASRGLGADGECGAKTWDKLLRGEE
ncbi:MAG: peptidoglycan-binding protein [Bacteroidales bacterium]|nr:peptidoglycan-binding protein [Bacteroidales bacterium]